jgi:hypothetical protein
MYIPRRSRYSWLLLALGAMPVAEKKISRAE